MNLEELDPKNRFSIRAKNYAKYRPDYPEEIIDFLGEAVGLSKDSVIADIGSGTGISTRMFLDNGNTVYAVEPNENMRQAAEESLQTYGSFHSVDGSSESTGLKSESIDVITAAQAFHWFDPKPTRKEFLRILKNDGAVVLMWNIRKRETDGFMGGYSDIVRRYSQKFAVNSNEDVMPEFFDSRTVCKRVFFNPQTVDFQRLKGELASLSYMPDENHKDYVPMMEELEELFAKYNHDGKVVVEYETELYCCRMK